MGLASRQPIRTAFESSEDHVSDRSYELDVSFSTLPENRVRRGMRVVEVDNHPKQIVGLVYNLITLTLLN